MARTLTAIYNEAKKWKDEYLEQTEAKIEDDSKMSIIDAIVWTVSACIWSFENVMDVFKVDIAKDIQNRVNGTPAYFANALMKYQSGDKLEISDDGASFYYPDKDENGTKKIIKKVSYAELDEKGFHDKLLLFKVATGEPGNYSPISQKELLAVREYMDQILFAGQHALVVSRKGDVLIPKLTVYYDGAISESEVHKNIKEKLDEFIKNLPFDGVVYVQKIIDCIQAAEHVTDVWVDDPKNQGIFVAQYDDDNKLIMIGDSAEQKVGRYFAPNSGFIRQSSKSGVEAEIPTWEESITLKLEDK